MHIPHISSCPIFYMRINVSRYSYNYVPHHKRNRTYCLSERLISHSSKGKHAQIVVCRQREAAYAVFMSPTNHKQGIEELAGSSAVSHPPFPLLFSSSPFSFTVLYFCYSHIGFLSALSLRIFIAKVQVVRHTSNRASMDAFEKSSSVCAI